MGQDIEDKSAIELHGGNVIDNGKDMAIVSDRVLQDNWKNFEYEQAVSVALVICIILIMRLSSFAPSSSPV